MLRIRDRVRFVKVGSTIDGGTFGMKPGTPGAVYASYVRLQNWRGRLTSVLKNATSKPIVSAICSSSGTCDGSTSFTSKWSGLENVYPAALREPFRNTTPFVVSESSNVQNVPRSSLS